MDENEDWREIRGCPSYLVSPRGGVWNVKKNHPQPQLPKGAGLSVNLVNTEGKLTIRFVHTLVAEAFIEPRPKGTRVRHIDKDIWNNKIENLEWRD